ncbi:copia-type polyprotein, partial [Trifolium medium]|nr:copia-type polyprotein [Trifolium medium]
VPCARCESHEARRASRGLHTRKNTAAPTIARIETVRLVVALACSKDWPMYHLDVKSAFLNGPLEELVYVTQPPGFEIKEKEDKVYRLHKALYGLKQAPRAWNKRIDQFLIKIGFNKCSVEYGIYVKNVESGNVVIICLYVDDLLITGRKACEIEKLKCMLKSEFEMTDLGNLSFFLGMEFVKIQGGIVMHQQKYISELLDRFEITDCKPISNPSETSLNLDECSDEEKVNSTLFKQIVGSLRYLCNSRPDICYSVSLIRKFMNNPKKSPMTAAKRILRYVKGSMKLGLLFPTGMKRGIAELVSYSDSDWCTKKQPVTTLSTCEAEYIAGTFATCQVMWLDSVMKELKCELQKPLKLLIDNKSAISLAKNPISHGRSKHIELVFILLESK